MTNPCNQPVALFVFNRPETTRKVFAAIRQARPPVLLVVADGPRADRASDVERCAASRAIISQVDWECDVRTNLSETNLGCRQRVSSGISWVFQQVESAIILEDDCLPDPTFFPFCSALLERYRDDRRIMAIAGCNFQHGRRRGPYSYYFSHYGHVWGWASWRRAWHHYDVNLDLWPGFRDQRLLENVLRDRSEVAYWTKVLDRMYRREIDTWDFQWQFAIWSQGGLVALSERNLVSNIGHGVDATHTAADSQWANLPLEAAPLPLIHPPHVVRDVGADQHTHRTMFESQSIRRIIRRMYSALFRAR